jgi:hypothetical protein
MAVTIEEHSPGLWHVVCDKDECKNSNSGWVDANSLQEAEEYRDWHLRWHAIREQKINGQT